MAEATMVTTVSRRSTRVFDGEQDITEACVIISTEREARQATDEKDQKAQKPPKKVATTITIGQPMIPVVDYGKDIYSIFPSSVEDMNELVAETLQAANESDKSRGEGRPINFGVVLPGTVYRSSFPMTEDFHFLGTLGLKTIISLVKKDFAPDFLAFMKQQGIEHVVIDMQGTKKVDIPEAVMHSIMHVALNKANYPLLIHCNHGKHRTGCAVAVIRHVAGWNVESIVKEYSGFAQPKVRECDVKYITDYQVARLQGLFTPKQRRARGPVLSSRKMAKLLIMTAAVLFFWMATGLAWPNSR